MSEAAPVADPVEQFRLDGRVVVVTGASAGLGRRFAEVVAAAGATVVATARRSALVEELAARVPRMDAIALDLTQDDERARLVAHVIDRHGRVDVLVNNAGVTSSAPAVSEPLEDIVRVVDLDLVATYDLARRFARHMIEQQSGAIVNVASISGSIGTGDIPLGAYAAAKAGVVGLTRELAAQWGRHSVRVNSLSPGWMDAGMGSWMSGDDAGRTWVERRTPMRRAGRPHELDGALLFLASDASTFVTGQDLIVDGGWTCI